MQVGFFFWPYTLELCEQLAERADRYGYAMIGIADTPGNAMDPWVSAAVVARASQRTRIALCVTNLLTRHPAVSAAAIASLDHVSNGRAVLGIGAGHSGTKNVGLPKSRANELAEGVTFIKDAAAGRAREPWRARPRICPGSSARRRSFLPPRIPSRCRQRARPPTASSPITAWPPRTSVIRRRTSSKAPRPPAARRTISRSGRSLRSTATRTATPRAARSAPCWPSSPATSSATRIWRSAACPSRCRRRCSSCGDATALAPARPTSSSSRSSACSIICRGGCRSAAIRQDCLAQALAAKAAGAKRLMLTVSLASDPVRTVELFGEHVLPKLLIGGKRHARNRDYRRHASL